MVFSDPADFTLPDLPDGVPVVLVPATVEGLAAAAVLAAAHGLVAPVLLDATELPTALTALADRPLTAPSLIIAGLPLDSAGLEAAAAALTRLIGPLAIEWYDNHFWSPDAQAAVWPVCRRAELGPDVPPPVHFLAHHRIPDTDIGRRLMELVDRGTDSRDPWITSTYRFLAGLLPPERANLLTEALSDIATNSNDLEEVRFNIVAEQTADEKAVERLVREELRVALTDRRTPVIVADLDDWSASPYLLLAARRFFTFAVLIRVLPTGRIVVETATPEAADLGAVYRSAYLAPLARHVWATRRRIAIDADPDRSKDVVQTLIDVL